MASSERGREAAASNVSSFKLATLQYATASQTPGKQLTHPEDPQQAVEDPDHPVQDRGALDSAEAMREEGSPGLLDYHGLLLLLLGRDHHHLQAQEPAGQEGGEVAQLEAG